MKDQVTLMLDTTGISLHKRGYRPEANEAPIRETLACGIADLARVRENTLLIDPCCGSGTFLVEGALKALKIPTGLKRSFVSEGWDQIPNDLWKQAREFGKSLIKTDASFRALGYDIDERCMLLVNKNSSRAGVLDRIKCNPADIKNFKAPNEPFVLLTNPPYGERMLNAQDARNIVKTMGQVFEPGDGRTYGIISPMEDFEEVFGRKAAKRRKLYNGMIKCQLFLYY